MSRPVVAVCIIIFAFALKAEAQDGQYEALFLALHRRVTVWQTPQGRQIEIGHCRLARMGCASRIRSFAAWIAQAAQKYSLDPWLLAGMAVHESGLNPFARGKVGEGGIYQLHPKGVGKNIAFVRTEAYRTRCKNKIGACQQEVIDRAAQTLRRGFDLCGHVPSALGYYNSGKCQQTDYAKRVMFQVSLLRAI